VTAPPFELHRVRMLLDAARWDDAVRALAPLVAAAPDDAEPRCLLAQAYLGMRRPVDAVEAATQALAVDPSSTWAVRLHALALHNAGRNWEAVTAARWLVSVEPDEWRAWWVLSVSARGCGARGVGEAVAAADRSVALAPEHADTHDALASALLASGRVREAEEAFRRALALDPTDAYAHNGLGQVALQRKDPVAAANGFRRALLADPRESAARHNLRVAFQQAARPLAFTVAACAVLLRFVTESQASDLLSRAAGAAAALVATAVLVWSGYGLLGRLDPTLRGFYRRLLLEDRRLAAGLGLHLIAVLTLYLVVALPRGADSYLWVVALLAVIVGRALLFRNRRSGVR
jgi:Flp pilus assembly protein TadD